MCHYCIHLTHPIIQQPTKLSLWGKVLWEQNIPFSCGIQNAGVHLKSLREPLPYPILRLIWLVSWYFSFVLQWMWPLSILNHTHCPKNDMTRSFKPKHCPNNYMTSPMESKYFLKYYIIAPWNLSIALRIIWSAPWNLSIALRIIWSAPWNFSIALKIIWPFPALRMMWSGLRHCLKNDMIHP